MIIDQFLIFNHALIISLGTIGLLFAITFLLLLLIHRQSRSVTYLLTANVILASCSYYIIVIYNHTNALFYQTLSPKSCVIVSYLMLSAAASISYSLMLQSLSRLFFIVFYRYKHLLSFKIHFFLLLCVWLISFTLVPLPCDLLKGFTYEPSLYLCALNTSSISVVVYAVITGCLIPFSIVGFVYFYIMFYIRKQRNTSVAPTANNKSIMSSSMTDRNLLVLRNIMINVTIMSITGLPSFVIMILPSRKDRCNYYNLLHTIHTRWCCPNNNYLIFFNKKCTKKFYEFN
jgi:hypothetical protein